MTNYYKEFADTAVKLNFNINCNTQFNEIGRNVSKETFNYLRFQIQQHGINHVMRMIKREF
jgi:hypothetical protein